MNMIFEAGLMAASFDPIAATDAYLNQLPIDAREKSDAYMEGGYWLPLWSLLLTFLLSWVLLASKFAAGLRTKLENKLWRWAVVPVFILIYMVITSIFDFPYTAYTDFFRQKKYDLLNQNFGEWFGEQLIGTILGLLVLPLLLWAIYGAIRKFPRAWPFIGSGIFTAFAVLALLISPVFLAPMFNNYTPMEDSPLKQDLVAMAAEAGIPADDIYVYDASTQSDRITANVSGLGSTMRISLADTLLTRTSPAETRAVMGHEMGHYVLGHTKYLIAFVFGITLLGLLFTRWGYNKVTQTFGKNWGLRGVGDVAGLPLLISVLLTFFLLATPLFNSLIRYNEVKADIFGLEVANEPDGFAEVSLKLSEYRKMSPGRFEEIIFHTHPSGRNRILRAMQYKKEMMNENPDKDNTK